ncbi:hypothetical protein MKZ38_002017 [Zalerion maritima]|uniref:Major facilitator superfamily (MFS) profile domain-containing protein n=1 Tax=Zalerion maritima TaxID=339359 RepID=A0AAD5RPK3_9PEZI|nr:hypothetical protein MKZ38_002017 [Zalerion maritima]
MTTTDPETKDVKPPGGRPVAIPSETSAPDEEASSEVILAQNRGRWNSSPINVCRFVAALYSFIVLGMNDACLGPLIPYIETYYDISYTAISTAFLSQCVGYILAATVNSMIHHHWGQRAVAIIAPLCHLVAYIPISFHPPFPAIPVLMILSGLGNGLEDSAWNAWIGDMENSNELLGLLHGAYGAGATIAPLVATTMITKAKVEWYTFFYVMAGTAALELVALSSAFWGADGAAYRERHRSTTGQDRTTTRRVIREPVTWLVAFFLLGYVGCEVSLGGWITTFMLNVRHAEPFDAGMAGTGFWLGLAVGRVVLGFTTGRIGEKNAVTIYLLLAIALELMYWFVPNFIASAVVVGFMGFFLGPLFPEAIVAATKLLPRDFHISAISVAASVGGCGAALIPFAVGAIAQRKGVKVLQPIVLTVLVFILVIWWALPGGFRRGGLERARENNEKVGYQLKAGWTHAREMFASQWRPARAGEQR